MYVRRMNCLISIFRGVETLATYNEAETYLKDYLTGKLDAQVETRKLELKYPDKYSSRTDLRKETPNPKVFSNDFHSTVEQDVLTYVDDGSYVFLKHYQIVIKRYWEYMCRIDELTCDIIRLFYYEEKSWVYISQTVNLSERACRKRRTKFIRELTEWL